MGREQSITGLSDLDRSQLAAVAREYLLAGQLMDRAGMPHIIAEFGREVMGDIAVDEWMGASPIYTRRIQQLLGFGNGDVETIFKGMQFDIGAPPEFMDFRYNITDANHGEFWLDHCGALMDVEPMGDQYVTTMCHDIEDPTFDATATATNPRARMTAIHRPPREPADREPHCHWQVVIDETVEPLPDPPQMQPLLSARLLEVPVAKLNAGEGSEGSSEDDGWSDYTTPLDPDLRLEFFSKAALLALSDEVALQCHLLVMALVKAIERRADTDMAIEIVAKQFIGSAALTAERLAKELDLGTGLEAIAGVFAVHPSFRPAPYVDLQIDASGATDDGELIVSLMDCPAVHEADCDSWITILGAGNDVAIEALAQAVDPHALSMEIDRLPGAIRSWRITLGDTPAERERSEVRLTRFSSGADFEFSEPVAVPVTVTTRSR
ncbi:MAG: hypothetical protein KDB26_11410 [Microthrixaceae bacterium]|nr:hypothetical protein [Microthrixaceae bacterium]